MIDSLRHALKTLVRTRAFSAIALPTLGIGAGVAIFTVVNALLLRPLPYADPANLVEIAAVDPGAPDVPGWLSFPHFLLQEQRNRSFSSIAASTFEIFNLTGYGDARQISSGRASWNFFRTLGVEPRLGRSFLPEEDRHGGRPVILISDAFWHRLFGGDPNALGRSLSLNGEDYTIVGILPPQFTFPMVGAKVDIWAPRVFDLSLVTPARVEAGGPYYHVIGRLRPGTSQAQARAETAEIYRQYRRDNPGKYDATVDSVMTLCDLREQFVGNLRPTILAFALAVALLLLIACSNIASLELARVLGRRKEFAVRTALGASRAGIVGHLLLENVLLSLGAAALGSVLGLAGTRYLASLGAADVPQLENLQPDLRVAVFAIALAVLSAVLIAAVPSLQLSRADLHAPLREEGRGGAGSRKRSRGRALLVVAQVALSTVLLVGSGLLIRSLVRLALVNPGFEPAHLVTLEMTLPPTRYARRPQLIGFYNAVVEAVRALPGVQSAALSTALPADPSHRTPALFEGQPEVPLGKRPIVNIQQLSPGYAATLRIPLREGRFFTSHDDEHAPPVAMVNQAAAHRFWPYQPVAGKHVWLGSIAKPYEVVGVMGDVKNSGLAVPTDPEIFLPLPQLPWTLLYLSVRTSGNPRGIVSAVRHAVATVDRDQPVTKVRTGAELLASANAQTRFTTFLIGLLAAISSAIAAAGIYGVIAYSVAQRTPELGIRIAIGAGKHDILRLVMADGVRLTVFGIVIGLAGSLAATRLMSSLLYETSPTDPLPFVASAALFVTASALASYLPARRAASIDPVDALRAE
jgi:putative ABC transport system permease protein